MEFTISNTICLRRYLKKMSKTILEIAIKFRKDGIKIFGMSPDNIIAAELLVPRNNLIGYRYKQINNIALSIFQLQTLLKRFSPDDRLKIGFKDNEMNISSANNNISRSFTLSVVQLDSCDEFPEFKPTVMWDIDNRIDSIAQVHIDRDFGPMVISSNHKGYSMKWIVAPKMIEKISAH